MRRGLPCLLAVLFALGLSLVSATSGNTTVVPAPPVPCSSYGANQRGSCCDNGCSWCAHQDQDCHDGDIDCHDHETDTGGKCKDSCDGLRINSCDDVAEVLEMIGFVMLIVLGCCCLSGAVGVVIFMVARNPRHGCIPVPSVEMHGVHQPGVNQPGTVPGETPGQPGVNPYDPTAPKSATEQPSHVPPPPPPSEQQTSL